MGRTAPPSSVGSTGLVCPLVCEGRDPVWAGSPSEVHLWAEQGFSWASVGPGG